MMKEQKIKTTVRNIPYFLLLAIKAAAKNNEITQEQQIVRTLTLVHGEMAEMLRTAQSTTQS